MLSHLQIRNFAIVPSLDLEIPGGFTAITGETGAGKSILVDALGLLLGDRSDTAWVRTGADRAELAAEFSVDENPDAQSWLEASDLNAGSNCLLRRVINANGRSRAYINGTPVTVAQIQALGHLLVEVHGQNEHLRLNRTSEQFKLLDKGSVYADLLENVIIKFGLWQAVNHELLALEQESAVSASDLELLNFQLSEMQQHNLAATAVEDLQNEHDRLAAGGSLLTALSDSIELLEPQTSGTNEGINAGLNNLLSKLQGFGTLDNDIAEACQMLEEAAVNCSESVNSLRAASDRVELNPERYQQVAAELEKIHDLARKHRVGMLDLESIRDRLAARIERAGSAEQLRKSLMKKQGEYLQGYRKASADLHKARLKHASILSRRVNQLMAELGMAGGVFKMVVTLNPNSPPSLRGDDELQILISANPGNAPGPLNKIASGGELSRISLAIKVASVGDGHSCTQVFDEVDAGIGGETANAVGRLLRRLTTNKLAGSGQALCVTHLAQVAVCADHHLQVSKGTKNDLTKVTTTLLDNTNRVDEIARMLSGNLSGQSRAHAAELLDGTNLES